MQGSRLTAVAIAIAALAQGAAMGIACEKLS
jgi:hypothetical protein